MKKFLFSIFLIFINFSLFSINIYRPFNNEDINSIPCYLRILDDNNNDITHQVAQASYSWYDQSKLIYKYKRDFYLFGGQMMHLKLKPGIYKLQFYTPKDKTYPMDYLKKEWISNIYIHNTESKLNVIFVSPTADDNYLYNGGWFIDYKAPKFFYHTVPKQYDFE